jgi:hypothetical protein
MTAAEYKEFTKTKPKSAPVSKSKAKSAALSAAGGGTGSQHGGGGVLGDESPSKGEDSGSEDSQESVSAISPHTPILPP